MKAGPQSSRASQVVLVVKNLPVNAEDIRYRFNPWVRKIPWSRNWQLIPVLLPGESMGTEEPGGLQSMGSQRVGFDRVTEQQTKQLRFRVIK